MSERGRDIFLKMLHSSDCFHTCACEYDTILVTTRNFFLNQHTIKFVIMTLEKLIFWRILNIGLNVSVPALKFRNFNKHGPSNIFYCRGLCSLYGNCNSPKGLRGWHRFNNPLEEL